MGRFVKSTTILIYKIIAVLSFLILLGVQFFLVYNTYKLKDEHYYFAEKNLINDRYSKSVRNDKVFPGGQKIIDTFINRNMQVLELQYNKDKPAFEVTRQRICDSLFADLRARSSMDEVFKRILKENKLMHNLKYRLVIKSLSVTFTGNNYITLFQNDEHYPLLNDKYLISQGADIDGTLGDLTKQNQVSSITVSTPTAHTYQITFQLYVDTPNRTLAILNLMKPTFALSFFSLLAVMLIYFLTFRNWLKQKKLAEMKSDFVNSITHEFHTPLATIMVANKSLQNDKIIEKKENIAPLTDIISRQSQRLKTIFSQVLDITVMNKATLKKESYFLHDLLEEILLDYRLTLTSRNVEITLEKVPQECLVSLDKFWFTTMLLNLFENAIKYNSSPVKKIALETVVDKKYIQLIISDNGIGMSSKTIRHIFEKFYRSKHKSTEDVNGLGLGLFYVNQCIRAHGWTLDVESKEGIGSKFIIFISKG